MRIFTFIFAYSQTTFIQLEFSPSSIYYLLLWVKTNLSVSAVCKLAWALRAAGLNRNYPRVNKNVIKFKTTAPSPALDSFMPQMLTVCKCFLCEALAWKHLNLIALYVCLYQKSYAQIHCQPSNS
uniref:SKCG1 n=1 Tax=Homo sapiens TaxID=9606 RepID=Q5ISC8_HUMAN|nr:SKCG1 [Homo sapiens]